MMAENFNHSLFLFIFQSHCVCVIENPGSLIETGVFIPSAFLASCTFQTTPPCAAWSNRRFRFFYSPETLVFSLQSLRV